MMPSFRNSCVAAGLVLCALVLAGCPATTSSQRRDAATDTKVVGNFSLRDLRGKRIQLRDFENKVVLLSFWASWCKPCHQELPVLQNIWQRHRARGFELVSIAVDPPDTESEVRQMTRRYRYEFPVLLDPETDVANRFNPTMDLPYSVLIDREGRIAAVHQGYRIGDEVTIENKINALLQP